MIVCQVRQNAQYCHELVVGFHYETEPDVLQVSKQCSNNAVDDLVSESDVRSLSIMKIGFHSSGT